MVLKVLVIDKDTKRGQSLANAIRVIKLDDKKEIDLTFKNEVSITEFESSVVNSNVVFVHANNYKDNIDPLNKYIKQFVKNDNSWLVSYSGGIDYIPGITVSGYLHYERPLTTDLRGVDWKLKSFFEEVANIYNNGGEKDKVFEKLINFNAKLELKLKILNEVYAGNDASEVFKKHEEVENNYRSVIDVYFNTVITNTYKAITDLRDAFLPS